MSIQICTQCGWSEIIVNGQSLHSKYCKPELGQATQALMKAIMSPSTMLGYGHGKVTFYPCGFPVTWSDADPAPGWAVTFNGRVGRNEADPTDLDFSWGSAEVSIHEDLAAEEVKILVDAIADARAKIYAKRAAP